LVLLLGYLLAMPGARFDDTILVILVNHLSLEVFKSAGHRDLVVAFCSAAPWPRAQGATTGRQCY
jgi:hypothetical protein